ncbi:DUF2187 domain-containing protein [Neobacillus notoginsengisoli]|uniref:DUF2187 domain-containing protein n=1 Tax=Neobacillus notoginsengisoli TaxID=1578198 RepID=A0A417YQ79_9BACI|nr:DUF2187 family protein [Neobacillus notoginsengisoli]RHW36029.1 DUF2187 domain-containing protein [Neobacillus notoginsengisoli]
MARNRKAKMGETIQFMRKGEIHKGVVFKVNENSVLVQIPEETKNLLDYETNRTVVGHKNYVIA